MYGSGNVRFPITPQNTSGFGKSGDLLHANANISIAGRVDYDYTRIPIRHSKSGTCRALTIGRY